MLVPTDSLFITFQFVFPDFRNIRPVTTSHNSAKCLCRCLPPSGAKYGYSFEVETKH